MKILETEGGWAVEHAGRHPIAIEGESYYTDRDLLVAAIERREMHVWSDGSIERTPENPIIAPAPEVDDEAWDAAAPAEDSSGAPPSEDPPTDPDAQPDDPDPNPIAPEPVTPKTDNVAPKVKRPRKPKATSEEEPSRGRGRPRVFSEDEAKVRRREKAREAAANRTPEQKAAAAERARKWRESNPDKVKAAREKSMKKRAERYDQDSDFRAHFNEYQREYKRVTRGSGKS